MNRALFLNRPANFMRGIALIASFLFLPASVSAFTYDDYLLATEQVGKTLAHGIITGTNNTAKLYRDAWNEFASLSQGSTLGSLKPAWPVGRVGPSLASYATFSNNLGKTFAQTFTTGLGASQDFSQKIWNTNPYTHLTASVSDALDLSAYLSFGNDMGGALADNVTQYVSMSNSVGESLAGGMRSGVQNTKSIYTQSFASVQQLFTTEKKIPTVSSKQIATNTDGVASITDVWNSATNYFSSLWNNVTTSTPAPVIPQPTTPKPLATPVAPKPVAIPKQPTTNNPPPTSNPITKTPTPPPQQLVVERTVERVLSGLTSADLESRIEQLRNELVSKIGQVSTQSQTYYVGNTNAIALTNKIDQLTNTVITTPTITGGTITNASISGGTISGTSASLSGAFTGTTGTLSGLMTVGTLGVGTTSPSDTFALNGPAYFAQVTAPSVTTNRLYNENGNLTWNGSVIGGSVGSWSLSGSDVYRSYGNVGIGTTSPYAKLSVVGEAVAANFTATSTTATSTFWGGINVATSTSRGRVTIQPSGTENGLVIQSPASYSGNLFKINDGVGTLLNFSSGGVLTLGDSALSDVGTSPLLVNYWEPGNGNALRLVGLGGSGTGNIISAESSSGTRFVVKSAGNVGIGTTSPYAKLSVVGETVSSYFTATTTTATSTFAGGLYVNNGAIQHDFSTGITSIGNLELGSLNFDTDAGTVSWMDMPVTSSATVGTVESYSAQLDGTPLITAYSQSDGAGNIKLSAVGIGTTTPTARLTVSTASTTENIPLFTVASSTGASLFTINYNGNIGIGTTSPWLPLSVAGRAVITATTTIGVSNTSQQAGIQVGFGGICVDNDGTCTASTTGRVSAVSYTTGATDLAENYTSSQPLQAGDIVETTGGDTVGKADGGSTVIGIVSTKPGIILGLGNDTVTPDQYPIALAGRVPVKVNLDGGEIKKGDRITLSSTPGIGMKATTSAYTVGIALEDFTSQTPGTVLAFVNLTWSKLDPSISNGTIATVTGKESSFWSVEDVTGRIKFISAGIDLNDQDIVSVRAIIGSAGKWSIDASGKLSVNEVQTNKLCVGETCVTQDEFKKIFGGSQTAQVSVTPPPTETTSPSSTPPVSDSGSANTSTTTPTEPPPATESGTTTATST